MRPPHPADLEVSRFERAYALLLGAIVRNDLGGDVELAWRLADLVVDVWEQHRPMPPESAGT